MTQNLLPDGGKIRLMGLGSLYAENVCLFGYIVFLIARYLSTQEYYSFL